MRVVRMRDKYHFDACHPSAYLTGYRNGTQCKNVDYAAYEYNVYVQCDYSRKKKTHETHETTKKKPEKNLICDNIG